MKYFTNKQFDRNKYRRYTNSRLSKVFIIVIIICIIIFFVISSISDSNKTSSGDRLTLTSDTILRHLKQLHKQINNINRTMLSIKEWSDYKNYREAIKRTLYDTYNPKNITKTNPHVLLHDVNVDCNTNYKFIVLVTSFVEHFDRRQLIRRMWGNNTMWGNTVPWKVIFNVGAVKLEHIVTFRKVGEESSKYKDIFMVDTQENFYLLSKKVMIALNWVYRSFKFDFILKVDDDIFVQIDRLVKLLNADWKHEHYIGSAVYDQPVERKGRYGVSLKEWPGQFYDPYCSGGGYLLSQEMIGRMIPHFNWDSPLKIDDAYIGHLVKLGGGHPVPKPDSFPMWNDKCTYTAILVVSHPGKTVECQEFMMKKSQIEMGRVIDEVVDKIEALYEIKKEPQTDQTVTKINRSIS